MLLFDSLVNAQGFDTRGVVAEAHYLEFGLLHYSSGFEGYERIRGKDENVVLAAGFKILGSGIKQLGFCLRIWVSGLGTHNYSLEYQVQD